MQLDDTNDTLPGQMFFFAGDHFVCFHGKIAAAGWAQVASGPGLRPVGRDERIPGPGMQLVRAPGRIDEEGQGGGLPQGDAGAAPVQLQQRIAADPAIAQPTTCWTTPSFGEALKATPGPPSRRCTSMARSGGALTFSCRCTRTGTWWKN